MGLSKQDSWLCSACNQVNAAWAKECGRCERDRGLNVPTSAVAVADRPAVGSQESGRIVCPWCNFANLEGRQICYDCHKSLMPIAERPVSTQLGRMEKDLETLVTTMQEQRLAHQKLCERLPTLDKDELGHAVTAHMAAADNFAELAKSFWQSLGALETTMGELRDKQIFLEESFERAERKFDALVRATGDAVAGEIKLLREQVEKGRDEILDVRGVLWATLLKKGGSRGRSKRRRSAK